VNIEHIDEIFRLLKQELAKYDPFASARSKIENTPFTTLISCILSLRTKDETTEEASINLLKNHNTPEKLMKLSVREIEELIYPVGFYKTKARRIKEIAKTIMENYSGKVPDDFNELLKLKGVGRKTANVVMVYGHRKHGYIPVDTHCHRISNRLGWVETKTAKETELALREKLPKKYWDDFNHLFVIFGKKICVPISPFCSRCPVERYCNKVSVDKSR
jgi:endonuclease-3